MSKAKVNQAVKKYLERMREVRGGSPTPESSYYSAPENLINDISAAMGLGVVCNAQVSSAGKFPDFGLFSKGQVSNSADGGRPEFGVIEMKGLNEDVREVAKRPQTQGYLATHSIVAVSNYREFLLLGRDKGGNRQDRDFISIAESEEEFWNLTKDPGEFRKGSRAATCRLYAPDPDGANDALGSERNRLASCHARSTSNEKAGSQKRRRSRDSPKHSREEPECPVQAGQPREAFPVHPRADAFLRPLFLLGERRRKRQVQLENRKGQHPDPRHTLSLRAAYHENKPEGIRTRRHTRARRWRTKQN